MEEKEIQTVQTSQGELQYYRNWDNDGSICMINPKTIKRYIELKSKQVNIDDLGIFFAFGQEQFDEGLQRAINKGLIKEGEKIYHFHAGMYGTKEALNEYFKRSDTLNAPISDECDPQEVYFYEYNNYECMYGFDGDEDAINIIIHHYGKEVAKILVRYSVCKEIE